MSEKKDKSRKASEQAMKRRAPRPGNPARPSGASRGKFERAAPAARVQPQAEKRLTKNRNAAHRQRAAGHPDSPQAADLPPRKLDNLDKKAPSLFSVPKRKGVLSETAQVSHMNQADGVTESDSVPQEFAAPQESALPPVLTEEPTLGEDGMDSDSIAGDDVGMLGIGSPLFPPHAHLEMEAQFEDNSGTLDWDETASVEARIRELQDRLDGLMAGSLQEDLDQAPSPSPQAIAPGSGDSAVDSAREVLQSEYYRKNWGRGAIRQQTFDVDDFGMDPDFEQKVRPAVEFLFKRYFRVEVDGIRNIPESGRAVVVANHSGALPWDGLMLREAIRTRHKTRNDLRWLAEDFSFYLPFLGVFINRMGAVRACQENAVRLLEREHLVGVFPEGAEGTKKLFRNRYRLQRFGRGGFVRLCLQTQSPIIPCAIVGAEETNPILYRFDNLSKLLGLDYLPVTPTFPALGPLGLIPAPTKWRIMFGEPISVQEYGPQAALDHVLVGRIAEQVRTSISNLLDTALRRRKSVWLG